MMALWEEVGSDLTPPRKVAKVVMNCEIAPYRRYCAQKWHKADLSVLNASMLDSMYVVDGDTGKSRLVPEGAWNTAGWWCKDYSAENSDPTAVDNEFGLSATTLSYQRAYMNQNKYPWGLCENVFGILGRGSVSKTNQPGILLGNGAPTGIRVPRSQSANPFRRALTSGLDPVPEENPSDSDEHDEDDKPNQHDEVCKGFRSNGFAVQSCGHSPHFVQHPQSRHRVIYHTLHLNAYKDLNKLDNISQVELRAKADAAVLAAATAAGDFRGSFILSDLNSYLLDEDDHRLENIFEQYFDRKELEPRNDEKWPTQHEDTLHLLICTLSIPKHSFDFLLHFCFCHCRCIHFSLLLLLVYGGGGTFVAICSGADFFESGYLCRRSFARRASCGSTRRRTRRYRIATRTANGSRF